MEVSSVKALLLTDLVDSTGTTARLGREAAARLWAQHDRCARDLLARWHGSEVDKTDGFLLLFDDVRQAAGYAVDYHGALASLPEELSARVGIHVAPIESKVNAADDVARGARPVEIANWLDKALVSRVMALAPGGRTVLTAEAAASLAAGGGNVRGRGHWQLQGLAEPVELFEAVGAEAEHGPLPDAAKAHAVVRRGERWIPRREIPNTLPAEHDSFVGRREALHGLALRLRRGARLVSILGAGGIGKTRLALRFARDAIGDFPGGVWFCDLSTARTLEGLVYGVAQGLGLPLLRDEAVRQIGVAIAGRPDCLVVLDNFEQVAELADGTIGRWLSDCPDATFLVTTRSALHVQGESICTVASMPPAEAAALFARRARDGGAELDGAAPETASIDALVRMLDGLPLALELAAARAKIMAPSAMLARMGERFRLLTSVGGRPQRQATLRTTLDWSWDLLGAQDRSALAQLSIFEGGFGLADAEAVLASSEDDAAPWAIDTLQSLLDHSMIRRAPAGRFEMLSSIQRYAAERLVDETQFPGSGVGLRANAERRHWQHFAAFDERRATADGCASLDNLVAACRRAMAADDAEAAVGALRGTWMVLRLTGPFRQAVTLGRQVERLGRLSSGPRSLVQRVLGAAHEMLGDIGLARACLDRAIDLAAEAGDDHGAADAHCMLGEHLYKRGDTGAARGHLTESRLRAEAIDDAALLGRVHDALGTLESRLGRTDEAIAAYGRALTYARTFGDVRREAGILGNLAMLAHDAAPDDVAQSQYEQALALARQVNDRRLEGNTQCNLGTLLQDRGDHEGARRCFEASLVIARAIGHAMLEGTLHSNLGILAERSADLEAAVDHHARAVVAAERLMDKRAEGQFRGHLGHCLAHLDREASAVTEFDRAHACLSAVGDEVSLGLLACQRAKAETRFGRDAEARSWLDKARLLLGGRRHAELQEAIEAAARLLVPQTH